MSRPKGSKNKNTLSVLRPKGVQDGGKYNPPRLVIPEPNEPEKLCYVCKRVLWGEVVYCGFGKLRHDACQVNSEEWNLYYQRQDKATQAKLVEFKSYKEVSP